MTEHKDPNKRVIGYYVRYKEWYAVSGLATGSEMSTLRSRAFRFKYRKDAVTWIKDRTRAYDKNLSDYRITRIVCRATT